MRASTKRIDSALVQFCRRIVVIVHECNIAERDKKICGFGMRGEAFGKQAPCILCAAAGIQRSRAERNRRYRPVRQCTQNIAPMLGVLKVFGHRGEFDQPADREPI